MLKPEHYETKQRLHQSAIWCTYHRDIHVTPYLLDADVRLQSPSTLLRPERRRIYVFTQLEPLVTAAGPGRTHGRMALVHHQPIDAVCIRTARILHARTAVTVG